MVPHRPPRVSQPKRVERPVSGGGRSPLRFILDLFGVPALVPVHARPAAVRRPVRRGVTGVLSMMFLILFSSLAVAMAVVSKGNLRTAETHLRVTRAQGAVDTGMEIAAARLSEAASRFIVAKGSITPEYAADLWSGTYSATPTVTILPPRYGRTEESSSDGIAEALAAHHASDAEPDFAGDLSMPTTPQGWVVANPISLEKDGRGKTVTAAQISYAPPDNAGRVRVIVTGYDWDWTRARWITRTAQQYFNISKPIEHAIVSPSRVMLGRNVQINGPLGVRYDSHALDSLDGPPVNVKSDFSGLDASLDRKLADFYARVLTDDVDGDGRLRVGHTVESSHLAALNAIDYDADSHADSAFVDLTKDGAVDDFDIFLKHYDANHDGKLILSATLTAGTAVAGQGAEFSADVGLALLIDSGKPDRNGNGKRNGRLTNGTWDYTTFPDNNHDGTVDSHDIDTDDVKLGYRDGVIDYKDQYAKIRGSIKLRASRSAWESSHDSFGVAIGDYQKQVQAPIRAPEGEMPVEFQVGDDELPSITDASFADAAAALTAFTSQAASFAQQVATAKGAGWSPPRRIEATPYGSSSIADWYSRPVYDGITFKDVTIPMGCNGLFTNCTFIGVTRVQCYTNNTHASWVFYGREQRNATTGALTLMYPPPPAQSPSALDQSYSTVGAPGYASLPAPLIVNVDLNGDGTANDQCTNTKQLSNNCRFHDCLFVGSIVADKPAVFQQARNKLQFTGATRFTERNPQYPDDPQKNPTSAELVEIKKSSMMLPNYSVDIGSNNASASQDMRLHGAIIAGVLDARGNTDIDGVLLLTYAPVRGQAPMSSYGQPVGDPADYNVTLGYFSRSDGDEEGIDLTTITDLDGNGVPDVGWDSARDPSTGELVPAASAPNPIPDSYFDGIPDTDAAIAAAGTYARRAIAFNGFGRITLNYNPNLVLPDGLAIPIAITPIRSTYAEGRFTE